jgi:4-hydroxy-4-methyl-2-oxoglutarate aldolase
LIPQTPRLEPEQLRALAQVDSPTLANAMETFNRYPRLGHFVGYDIKCLYPELPPTCGYAVTCRGDSTTEGRTMERGLVKLWETLANIPGPTVVVIQDVGTDRLHSCHCGEVMATTMKRLGAVGLLTDGGVRDLPEVRALGGFQFFAAGLVVAHGNPLIFDVGADLTISGMPVKMGDLLHGDANGLLNIPHDIAPDIVRAAEQVRAREHETLRRVLSPDFSPFEGPRKSEH